MASGRETGSGLPVLPSTAGSVRQESRASDVWPTCVTYRAIRGARGGHRQVERRANVGTARNIPARVDGFPRGVTRGARCWAEWAAGGSRTPEEPGLAGSRHLVGIRQRDHLGSQGRDEWSVNLGPGRPVRNQRRVPVRRHGGRRMGRNGPTPCGPTGALQRRTNKVGTRAGDRPSCGLRDFVAVPSAGRSGGSTGDG